MPRVSSKDKYIAQTFELFKREGLSLNMEQIAVSLGLTKKTLYNNFTSKENLINSVLDYFFKSLENKIQTSVASSSNAIEVLLLVGKAIGEEINSLGEKVLSDFAQYRFTYHRDKSVFYDKIIRENLKRGISEGLYRTNINFDYSALFYNAAVDFFYSWNGQFNFFEQTATYFFELVKHHLYSIVNIEGRKVLDSYL
ncbi:MAG: TetR/AcrR family transcriptional regulator [Bacteroidales bacterium]|nr:TetR/AcrR family transcriptional regulator [Bacteroidales bacterium]MBQ1929263.1 TetR/AcrR family transcriptional regulator [Bacteroidales bacterium]MBQ5784487.1 TetR/AcrR family transcriptional regulator [Bacteroidales bacterium]